MTVWVRIPPTLPILWGWSSWLTKLTTGYDLPFSPVIIRSMHRRFIQMGFTCKEACNLLAKLMGLKVTHQDWTLKQLTTMLFLEYIDKKQQP